jgi:hypothetical protein
MVPEQKPAVTPGGKPTLRKRTKTDRNEVYTRALASTVLATAKEALAVAPGTDEARVLVIRNDVGAATPVDHLGAIYVGRFARAALRAVPGAPPTRSHSCSPPTTRNYAARAPPRRSSTSTSTATRICSNCSAA